jgi:hypothetical protein
VIRVYIVKAVTCLMILKVKLKSMVSDESIAPGVTVLFIGWRFGKESIVTRKNTQPSCCSAAGGRGRKAQG